MSLIKIFENENFIIDYDKEEKQYRASYFVNNHWVDECWFDPYEEEGWVSLSEQVPPPNEKVVLRFFKGKEERTVVDRLIRMLNGTYLWEYGDYSSCVVTHWKRK